MDVQILDNDLRLMNRALELASRGHGAVEPNPMVGAIVVDTSGNLAGEGWHQQFGGPHAEVYALQSAGERARGGTLYATLEPCCHHGKTPPCTDAVLAAGLARVVVAQLDPFPAVAGNGVAQLRAAGIRVDVGIAEYAARSLNAPYHKRLRTGRPWVIAKWAMTLDGKIATSTGDSRWISSPESRQRVHELRGRVDAILVGRQTVIADDPLLTARPAGSRIPVRVVVTSQGQLPDRCQLRQTADQAPLLIATTQGRESLLESWIQVGAEVLAIPTTDRILFIQLLLDEFGRRGMTNILVEGGAGLLGSFFDAGAVDEVWVFVAPTLFGGAGPSPVSGTGAAQVTDGLRFPEVSQERIGDDLWIRARRLD